MIYAGPARQKGFTLLEIMVAMTIVAVIFTSLYGTFNASMGVAQDAKDFRDLDDLARLILLRVSSDLESSSLPPKDQKAKENPFLGQAFHEGSEAGTILEFFSNACLDFEHPPPCYRRNRIQYRLQAETEEAALLETPQVYSLYRIEQPFAGQRSEQQSRRLELADNVTGLTFHYLSENGDLQESWNSTRQENILPRKIQIDLTLETRQGTARSFSMSVFLNPGQGKKNEDGA